MPENAGQRAALETVTPSNIARADAGGAAEKNIGDYYRRVSFPLNAMRSYFRWLVILLGLACTPKTAPI